MKQKTLGKIVHVEGTGVHSGRTIRMNIYPAEGGGIVFRRMDLGGLEFYAGSTRIQAKNCSALLSDRGEIRTVEHLMAALYMLELDHALVELDGPEVPIMDGSSKPFADLLQDGGSRSLPEDRLFYEIIRPFILQSGEGEMEVRPHTALRISYLISYDHPAVGRQENSFILDKGVFLSEIAPARTFGFMKDAEMLKRDGLAGGASLENTVVLDDEGVINGPLRFHDEFVRHKILDLIGDLALFGYPLRGHFLVKRGGHVLHHKTVKYLKSHPDAIVSSKQARR